MKTRASSIRCDKDSPFAIAGVSTHATMVPDLSASWPHLGASGFGGFRMQPSDLFMPLATSAAATTVVWITAALILIQLPDHVDCCQMPRIGVRDRMPETQQEDLSHDIDRVSRPHVATSPPWYLVAALLSFGASFLTFGLERIALPFDQHFKAVLYLMWSGTSSWEPHVRPILLVFIFGCLLIPLVLIGCVLQPQMVSQAKWRRLVDLCFRYALVVPIAFFLCTSFGRYVTNLVYFSASPVSWDFTTYLAPIEAPALELLQRSLDKPALRTLCSWFYSVGWYIPVVTLVPVLVMRDKSTAVNRVLTAQILTAVLAVPFFVLIPIFEPWTLNPLYGSSGSEITRVRYLYPDADTQFLTRIAQDFQWATGSCLPSLHFAFPYVLGLLLWRSNLRLYGVCFLALAVITAFAVVYLGRHWVIDVIAAIPYGIGIVWASERLRWRFTLGALSPAK